MKAVVCRQWGSPDLLKPEEFPAPVAGPGQVVLDVKAAGLNYPDALVVQGKHQYKPPLPFGLGSEVAGVVAALGEGVKDLSVGQRVYGSGFRGSFAEQMAIDAVKLHSIPEHLSFEQAAAIPITYNTSYFALATLASLVPGESVLVLGAAGGVGIAAIQIAKALNARVIAAASSAAKLEVCRANGADEVINYREENLRERLREIAGSRGVDVVYDPVGGDYAEVALRALGWRGRYLVIGFAESIPRLPLNLVLLKNASVIGVFYGEMLGREPETARRVHAAMAALVAGGRIRPHVSARYRLDQVPEAMYALLERRATGKVVITP
ncbi:MAG: NADPH:quinone oxidoreductase family protein [Gammaproteobacteria bacterium]